MMVPSRSYVAGGEMESGLSGAGATAETLVEVAGDAEADRLATPVDTAAAADGAAQIALLGAPIAATARALALVAPSIQALPSPGALS